MIEYDGEWIYALFCQQLKSGWLVGGESQSIIDRSNQKVADFTRHQPNFISISTTDLTEFIADFMAGCRLGIPIFLCNPYWGDTEWEQVSKITSQVNPQQHQNLIMIPTGGSTGAIKFATHTWETLSASVWGFQEFYAVDKINAICTLPLYHVSGLMQLIRSIITDGRLLVSNFQQLCIEPNLITNQIELDDYFISLVPTQLAKLLDLDPKWLAQFQTILLGGAPPNLDLLNRARSAQLSLALTYGMTETASQVTSLKPAEFLAGNNSCGRVLPHAKIKLRSPNCEIQIEAKSLMLGYFPVFNSSADFEPDDLGSFDSDGYLTIIGRTSGKIITGGENVFPIEVINAIMLTGLVADVWVIGLLDRYWGQIVVAVYVENNIPVSGDTLSQAISGKISKYKIPKHWVVVDLIPRNSLGKVLIPEIEKLLRAKLDRNS
ncbi:MAG: AMP-binding protein [Chamaesiphon sp.]|nr:AMP-binding protein [Chamaesiphon sp.]